MGKCIGNCIQCELVSREDKVTCCVFQTLKQEVEIRTQLKDIIERLDTINRTPNLEDTELPAVVIQGDKIKRPKK